MRSTALASALISLWLAGCSCNRDSTVNPNQGAEDQLGDAGEWLSMALMPDGAPAISFYDRDLGGLSFAIGTVKGDGSVSWAREKVDGYPDDQGLDSADVGMYSSLAIASDGTAWVSYYDATNHDLRYATRSPSGGTWTTGVADTGSGPSPDAGRWTSIALDSSGRPVIAHYDAGQGQLRVAHWGGSGFTGEVVDQGQDYRPADTGAQTVPADVGRYARLSIRDGVETIAYYDAAAGNLDLATGTAGSYQLEVVDEEGDVGAWPSTAWHGGELWIAYQDAGNQDLRLAHGSPGAWTTEVVDDGDWRGADSELFFDGDSPSILYFDGYDNDIVLARLVGGSWSIDTLAGQDAALGYHNETVLAGTTRYVACYDYTNRTIWFSEL